MPLTPDELARRLAASRTLRRIAECWPGGRLFLTGGSLRDLLLGLPTHDLDLVVDGDARAAAHALADRLGGRPFPLGRPPLVTWRLTRGRRHFDLAPMQGRLEEDIRRRDFTVNALIWRLPRGPLLDLVGGIDDLVSGRVRVVREANLRADPLRVLRGVRLVATRPQLRLTAEAAHALAAAAPELTRVASERVIDELRQTVTGAAAGRALLLAARTGILAPLLPSWAKVEEAEKLAALADRISSLAAGRGQLAAAALEVAPAVLAAPAAGFPKGWSASAAAAALARLGWPDRTAERLAAAVGGGTELAGHLAGGDTPGARALAADLGLLLPLAAAWVAARDPDLAAPALGLLLWWRRFSRRAGLLGGDEIAALLSLPPGPERAEAVRSLRRAQARGEVRNVRQARRWLLR